MAGVRQTAGGVVQTAGGGVASTVAVDIIDSFEDQDLSEYGSSSGVSIVDEANLSFDASDGSFVLENTPSDGFARITSQPGDGLANYFSKGDVAKCAVRTDAAENLCRVLFGVGGGGNRYLAEYRPGDTNFELSKVVDGTLTTIAIDSSVSYSLDTWGTITITWDDGSLGGSDNDITLEYDEGGSTISTISANDSAHATNEGIGFEFTSGRSNATFWADWYRLP